MTNRRDGLDFRILDGDGRPAVGGCVFFERFVDGRREFARIDADGDGRVTSDERSARAAKLWIEASDSARVRVERSFAYEFAEIAAGEIRLFPGPRAFGWVLTEDGRAVENAKIAFEPWYYLHPGSVTQNGPWIVVTSDRDGRFRTPPLPPGNHDVTIEAAGHALASLHLFVSADGMNDIELGTIVLGKALAVTGRVEDADGRPIEGATVRPSQRRSDRSAETSADGRFVCDHLAVEDLNLDVDARGFKRRKIDVTPGETREVSVALKWHSRTCSSPDIPEAS